VDGHVQVRGRWSDRTQLLLRLLGVSVQKMGSSIDLELSLAPTIAKIPGQACTRLCRCTNWVCMTGTQVRSSLLLGLGLTRRRIESGLSSASETIGSHDPLRARILDASEEECDTGNTGA
jgi:hypothetical protein